MILRLSVLLFLLSTILSGCKTPSMMWRQDAGSEQDSKCDNYECRALAELENRYRESLKKQEKESQTRQKELEILTRENLLEARKILEDKISVMSVNDVDVLVDAKNKLMWSKSGCIVESKMSWQESKVYVTGFKYAGYSDWRLPTISELKIAYLVQTKFSDLMYAFYWSSTPDGIDSVNYLDMSNGNIGKIFKTNEEVYLEAYLLPVRDLK